jgi:hypothetical protein
MCTELSKFLLTSATVVLISAGAKADGPIIRHAADFFKFNGTEFTTTITAATFPGPPDGALFYAKTVLVPSDSNVLFVSIYATGDAHGGAADWFSCRINGALCRPQSSGGIDKAPGGWITLVKIPTDASGALNNCNDGGGGTADCHDNAIAYSWCAVLPPRTAETPFTVNLKFATSIPGANVFLEKAHVYIDSSRISQTDRCASSPTPPSASESGNPLDLALKAAAAKGVPVATTVRHH